uniref:Uncharacterized protein n=1 Tax=Leersia perrieri TaxID=77586 RepID=A0A0D9VWK4_9ORYZ
MMVAEELQRQWPARLHLHYWSFSLPLSFFPPPLPLLLSREAWWRSRWQSSGAAEGGQQGATEGGECGAWLCRVASSASMGEGEAEEKGMASSSNASLHGGDEGGGVGLARRRCRHRHPELHVRACRPYLYVLMPRARRSPPDLELPRWYTVVDVTNVDGFDGVLLDDV